MPRKKKSNGNQGKATTLVFPSHAEIEETLMRRIGFWEHPDRKGPYPLPVLDFLINAIGCEIETGEGARNSLKMRNFTIRIGTQRGSQMANCFILFTERSPEWSKMRSLSFLDSLLAIRKRSIRWLILPLHCFLSGEWSLNLAVTALICGSCMPSFARYKASMFGRMTMASRSNRRRSAISTLMIGKRLPKT